MRWNFTRWMVFSWVLFLVGLSESRSQTTPSSASARLSEKATTLSFRLYWDYLVVVEGSIGERHHLSLLVDTGASPSVVDRNLARELHLHAQKGKVNLARNHRLLKIFCFAGESVIIPFTNFI